MILPFLLLVVQSQRPYDWSTYFGEPQPTHNAALEVLPDGENGIYSISTSARTLVVSRFDSSGHQLWHVQRGGTYASALVSGGDLVLSYHPLFVTPGGGGGGGSCVERINSAGGRIWRTEYSYPSEVQAVSADTKAFVFVAGMFASNRAQTFCLTKLSFANGKSLWTTKLPLQNRESSRFACDGTGNLFAGGSGGTSLSDRKAALCKISPSGVMVWSQTIDESSGTSGVATDAQGNVFQSVFKESMAFEGDPVISNESVIKHSSDGKRQWLAPVTLGGTLALDVTSSHFVLAVGASGVARINPAGKVLWTTAFRASSANAAVPLPIDAQESLYVMSGRSSKGGHMRGSRTFHSEATIAKIDQSGRILWTKTESGSANVSQDWPETPISRGHADMTTRDRGASICLATNGQPIFAATVNNGRSGMGDLRLVRYDPSGKSVWRNDCDFKSPNYGVTDVATDSEGNTFFLAAYDQGVGPQFPGVALKVSSSGVVQWSRSLSSVGFSRDLISPAPGGGAVIARIDGAISDLNTTVDHLDNRGQIEWTTKLPHGSEPWDLKSADDGSVFVAGSMLNKGGSSRSYLLTRLNSSGTKTWSTVDSRDGQDICQQVVVDGKGNSYSPQRQTLCKFNPAGKTVWKVAAPGYIWRIARGESQLLVGGVQNGSSLWVGAFDLSGKLKWQLPIATLRNPGTEGYEFVASGDGGAFFGFGQRDQARVIGHIVKVSSAGKVLWSISSELINPHLLAADGSGGIFAGVRKSKLEKVHHYEADGKLGWAAGPKSMANGLLIGDTQSDLSYPSHIAVDSRGSVYLSEAAVSPRGTTDLHLMRWSPRRGN